MNEGWPELPANPDSEAVAFQVDPQHDGAQPNDTLRLPLELRWQHDFPDGNYMGYPVVARGRVFVNVGPWLGPRIVALSSETGDLLWSSPVIKAMQGRGNLAYQDERVFFVNGDSVVIAFDAGTGKEIWRLQLPDGTYSVHSTPVISGRILYVATDSYLYALAGSTGQTLWRTPTQVARSSPTVAKGNVFYSALGLTEAFDAQSGAPLWSRNAPADDPTMKGSTDASTAAFAERWLYVRSPRGNWQLNEDGSMFSVVFQTTSIPAVTRQWIVGTDTAVHALPLSGSSVSPWDSTVSDHAPTGAALIVGDKVALTTDDGELRVLNLADGTQVSHLTASQGFNVQFELSGGDPVVGLAAAENRLFVPVRNGLAAY